MVLSLEEILHVEDINYVSGSCAVLLGKTDLAKTFFAKSVKPQVSILLLFIYQIPLIINVFRMPLNCVEICYSGSKQCHWQKL